MAKNIKILAISDIHNDLERLKFFIENAKKEGAFIFFAGDLTRSEEGDIEKALKLLNEVDTIFITGNNERTETISSYLKDNRYRKIKLIDWKLINFRNLRILGIPGSNKCCLTPNVWDEIEAFHNILEITENFSKEIDIILAHCPPYGYLDLGYGSSTLKEVLFRTKVPIYITGHVHDLAGQYEHVNKEGYSTIILNGGNIGLLLTIEKTNKGLLVKKIVRLK